MLHNSPIFQHVRPHLVFIAIALVAILANVACSESDDPQETPEISSDGLALVWEAWEQISENYVSSEPLDAEAVVSGAMGRLLNEVEMPPYPFLTEIGRMRGQPPADVPGEMVDLWRAVAKFRAANLEFDSATVAESVVTGLLEGLIHSSAVYLDATQYPLAKESLEGGLEGSYLGIGSRVVALDGQIVLFPFAGSPSESAGILPGDVLVAVAGASVLGQSVQEVVDQVAGPKGSKVLLGVIRAGEIDPVDVEVFRGDIELQSVVSQLIPGGIGYLRIARFRDNTGEQVFTALEELNQFDMLGLVVDIRTNPGGSSEAAVETAGQFLPDGTLFGYIEGKDGQRTEITTGPNENRLSLDDLLVAVLINEQTSREAETLAAALHDSGRATLFGTTTLGDASSYEFVELSDGSAMYLPVARRFSLKGELMTTAGIVPDVEVESVAEDKGYGRESQFNRAYEFLDGQLPPFR